MSQDNQDLITLSLIQYANNLERQIFEYAKYDVLIRKSNERKIQNFGSIIDK